MTVKPLMKTLSPRRTLILASCGQDLDAYMAWLTQLCAKVGRTDVLKFVLVTDKPTKEYDGIVYTERVDNADYPSGIVLIEFLSLLYLLTYPKLFGQSFHKLVRRYASRNFPPWAYRLIVFFREKQASWRPQNGPYTGSTSGRLEKGEENAHQAEIEDSPLPSSPIKLFDRLRKVFLRLYIQGRVSNALFERAKSSSIVPRLIICHDLCTLKAAIKLKDLFGTPVIYDSCQLTSRPDGKVAKWQKSIKSPTVGNLIRRADVVVTARPEDAHLFDQLYGAHHVLYDPDKGQSVRYFNVIKTLYER